MTSPTELDASIFPRRNTRSRDYHIGQQRLERAELGIPLHAERFLRGFSSRISKKKGQLKNSMNKTARQWSGRSRLIDHLLSAGPELARATPDGELLREQAKATGFFSVLEWTVTRKDGSTKQIGWLFIDYERREWMVLSEESAARKNQDGLNDFVQGLTQLHAAMPVDEFDGGEPDRLIRDDELATNLTKILKTNRTLVWLDGDELNLLDERDYEDWLRAISWASKDRRRQLRKMGGAMIDHAKDGLWPASPDTLPLGITALKSERDEPPRLVLLEGEDRLSAEDKIAAIVESTGWHHLSYPQIAEKLGREYGVTTPLLQRGLGASATIADGSPYIVVKTVWAWLEAYQRNAVLWRHTWPSLDPMGRRDLIKKKQPDGTYVLEAQVLVPFPRWDCGLAPGVLDSALANVAERFERDRQRGGRKANIEHQRLMPMPSLVEWTEIEADGMPAYDYKLFTKDKSYELRRRIHNGKKAWLRNKGTNICSVGIRELHSFIADSLIDLTDGTNLAIYAAPLARAVTAADPRAAALRKADALRKQAAKELSLAQTAEGRAIRAESDAAEAEDEDLRAMNDARRAELDEKAKSHRLESVRLVREAQALEQQGALDEAERDQADVSEIVYLAALLRHKDVTAIPQEAVAVLRRLVGDTVRLRVLSPLQVEVSLGLKFSTNRHDVVMHSLTGVLANTSRRGAGGSYGAQVEKRNELARLFGKEGIAIFELSERLDLKPEYVTRLLREWFADHITSTGRVTAMLWNPIPHARSAFWHRATGTTLPDEINKAFADHIWDCYTSTESWGNGWAMPVGTRREALLCVSRYQSDAELGVPMSALYQHVDDQPHVISSFARAHSKTLPVLEKVGDWAGGADPKQSRVRLPFCTGCKTRVVGHVLRVPEVPELVLCPACRHMPSDPTVTFPAEYLRLWLKTDTSSPAYRPSVPTATVAAEVGLVPSWKRSKGKH